MRIARVEATGWSLVGQSGAFAFRRGSVKNWMDQESHASRPGKGMTVLEVCFEGAAGPAQRATMRYIASCLIVTRRSHSKSRRCG